jgi:uncharacterized membrane protein YdjX (TVP38/TMEM64 family)
MWVGYPLCLIYNTLGASCLYLLSLFFGRRLVIHSLDSHYPTITTTNHMRSPFMWCACVCYYEKVQRFLALRLEQFSSLLRKKSGSTPTLFMYLVSVRVFPFTPNW